MFEALTDANPATETPASTDGAPEAVEGQGTPTAPTTAEGGPASPTGSGAPEPDAGAEQPTEGEPEGTKPSRKQVGEQIKGELETQVQTLAQQVETLTKQLDTAKTEGAQEAISAEETKRQERLKSFFGTAEEYEQAKADSKAGDYEGTQKFHSWTDNRELYGDLVTTAQNQAEAIVRENLQRDYQRIFESIEGLPPDVLSGASSIPEMAAAIYEFARNDLEGQLASEKEARKNQVSELEATVESLRARLAASGYAPISGGRSGDPHLDMNARPSDLLAAGFEENERSRRGAVPAAR
jgi:predicted  nucleic acid-binding Zn-ribbon protein